MTASGIYGTITDDRRRHRADLEVADGVEVKLARRRWRPRSSTRPRLPPRPPPDRSVEPVDDAIADDVRATHRPLASTADPATTPTTSTIDEDVDR